MGQLGGISIADATATHQSGAALLLNEEPPDDKVIQVDQDWEVEVQSCNPYVVARGTHSLNPDTVLAPAHEAIQKALDKLCIQGAADLYCRDVDVERIIWWRDGGDQCLRVVSISGLAVSTSVAVTKISSSGQTSSPQPPPTQWHESQRYFRFAQIADNLFDAYRNMFLAFEMILSHRVPPKSGEREKDWLKRALKDAHNQIGIRKFAPNQSNVVDSIYQQQYVDTRIELFHAKQNRSRLLPHDVNDREKVQEALENLSPLVVTLMKNTLTINRNAGVMTHAGFDHAMSWTKQNSNVEVTISPDNTPLSKSETLSSPPWQNRTSLPTTYSVSLSEPGLKSVLGKEQVTNLSPNTTVRRLGFVNKDPAQDTLMTSARLEQDLTLGNIDQFEAQLGMSLRNQQTAKTRFPS